ncbi:hypothetical protein HDU89_003212 [Geranomyces variabilis]|nr:hypothetical protein HDU89_003212 [Geranomyces variabilis]
MLDPSVALAIAVGVVSLLLLSHAKSLGLLRRPHVDAPGPKGLPLLANALLLADYVKRRAVIKLFMRITDEFGPVASMPILNRNVMILADPELSRWVLKSPELFGVNEGFKAAFDPLSKGLLNLSGDTWKLHRKLVVPAFSVKHLRLALEVVHDRTDDLLAFWRARHIGPDRAANVHAHLTAATFDMIGGIAFSYNPGALQAYATAPDLADSPAAAEAASRVFKPSELEYAMNLCVTGMCKRFQYPAFSWKFVLGPSNEDAWRANISYVRGEVKKVILQRDKAKQEGLAGDVQDVLDRLLMENEEGDGSKLSDEEVIDEVIMFFLAGHETSANTMTWTLLKLAEHPDVVAKLRVEIQGVLGPVDRRPTYDDLQQMPYMTQVIRETLRIHPVAPSFGRRLLADTHIGGRFVEKGATVMMNVQAIHLSRAIYGADSNVFRPERWDNGWSPAPGSYLPFGHGPKSCVGEKLAMMEIRAILSRVVHNFDFELVLDQSFQSVHTVTHGLKDGLKLKFTERKLPLMPTANTGEAATVPAP